MIVELSDEEIRAECIRWDKRREQGECVIAYHIEINNRTFRLTTISRYWGMLCEGERWCLVKSRNLFETKEDCEAAIERALTR